MAGSYGCITKNKSSAISAFGAMSIVIFALGLLICIHEHCGLSEEPLKLKNHQNVSANCTQTSVTNSDENSLQNSKRNFTCSTTRYLKKANEDYILLGRHKAALGASIVFCVFGIIFGILLMHAPKSQSKEFCMAWIAFGSCTTVVMFIVGVYIAAIQGPYQQIVEVNDAINVSDNYRNATSEQNTTISPPENTNLSPATTTSSPATTSSSSATTSSSSATTSSSSTITTSFPTTTTSSPTTTTSSPTSTTSSPTTTTSSPATTASSPATTASSPATTASSPVPETVILESTNSTSEVKPRSARNSGSTKTSSDLISIPGETQRSVSEDDFSVYQKYELVISRSFPLSAIYLLNVWPFLLWSVVATYLSMNGIADGRDE